jgi:hypothetical protein
MKQFILLFVVLSSLQCLYLLKPTWFFQSSDGLRKPDYQQPRDWAALPTRNDMADTILPSSGFQDNQANANVDVFFIHPTTYLMGVTWNGDLDNQFLNERTDQGTIKHQASVFNGCCKVYAPRYRQAIIHVFLEETVEGKKALDLAYEDVVRSFTYYMEKWNQGRPFILASHSQGTLHGLRLLKEKISGTEYQKRMVAAYLVGFPFNEKEVAIPICATESQTGCVVNWNSFLYGKKSNRKTAEFESSVCVNPLSWKKNEEPVSAEKNPGSVNRHFDQLYVGAVDAKCEGGYLWVHKPKMDGIITLQSGDNYHVMDYAFFYKSIRDNSIVRAKAFRNP